LSVLFGRNNNLTAGFCLIVNDAACASATIRRQIPGGDDVSRGWHPRVIRRGARRHNKPDRHAMRIRRCILLPGTLLRAPFPDFPLWFPRARVDLAVTGIHHQPFKIRFTEQYFKRLFPYPFISPANEAPACCSSFSFRRQITPRRSCPQYPENGVDNQVIIFCRPALARFAQTDKDLKTPMRRRIYCAVAVCFS